MEENKRKGGRVTEQESDCESPNSWLGRDLATSGGGGRTAKDEAEEEDKHTRVHEHICSMSSHVYAGREGE